MALMTDDDEQRPAQSKYTNFGRYLAANRGAAGAAAGQIAEGIETAGEGVDKDLKTAQDAFTPAVAAGSLQYNKPGLNTAPAGAPQKTGPAVAPLANAAPAAQADALRNRTYTGPQGLGGFDNLMSRGSAVTEQANATGSEAGLGALMQKRAQGPYSSGARRFDAGLVGAAGGDQFENLRDRYGKLSQRLDDAGKSASSLAGRAAEQTKTAAAQYGADADGAAAATAADVALRAGKSKEAGDVALQTADRVKRASIPVPSPLGGKPSPLFPPELLGQMNSEELAAFDAAFGGKAGGGDALGLGGGNFDMDTLHQLVSRVMTRLKSKPNSRRPGALK